jgi:tetratricopeptide (TPR) repeat protein
MSKKPGALHNLADAMSEDILNTPGDDLLCEVEEDYGDPQALAVQFDRIRAQAESEALRMGRAAARPARSPIVDFRPPWKIVWVWNHSKPQGLRLDRLWTRVGNRTAWLGAAVVLVVLTLAPAVFRSTPELSEKSDQPVAHGEGQLVAEAKRATLKKEASDFYRKWSELGDNDALLSAIERFKQVVDLTTRERMSLDWAEAQNNLGLVQMTLGKRVKGRGLEAAVVAFREALKERTRERVPLAWADTQNNLGLALMSLGERENGTAQLEEAVAAFGEALKERTRERAPLAWADTQNNLGLALARLGERKSRTAQLEEAVAGFREALKEWTRERAPLDWAETQNNLGLALMSLGERGRGTAQLKEAVAAFREALKERTREHIDWADTQNNLGLALVSLAEREKGRARLKEGIAALREALKERTRDRVIPPDDLGEAAVIHNNPLRQ